MNNEIPNLVDQNLLMQEEAWLWDVASERGVLACIIQKPDLLWEADRLLRPEWFFNPLHRYIYQVMLFVARQSLTNNWQVRFDEFTVMAVAKQCGPQFVEAFLKKTEGMAKWKEIAEAARFTTIESFGRYMATVRDRAARVHMYRDARRLQRSVMDLSANPVASNIAGKYESRLGQIAFGSSEEDESRLVKLGNYSEQFHVKARLNHAYPDKHLFHLRFPHFPYWMSLMGGGFRRNSLSIIAARPKVGKTTMLLFMAIEFASLGIPVCFLDTEMSADEMISRELSNIADLDEHLLIAGKFLNNDATTQQVAEAISRIQNSPFYYASIAGKPIEYGVSLMRQFRNQLVGSEILRDPCNGNAIEITKPCVVFYDWLKLPVGSASESIKEYQLLGDLCTQIKDTARLLNLPVIAGAQQNRGGVGKDEQDHAENAEAYISGSDRLAMFCNTLCILRNPSMKLAEEIEANWPNARGNVPEDAPESQKWPFNQILQVILQRQGRDCRFGIPFFIDRGRARYEEVIGEDREGYLQWLKADRRGDHRPEWFKFSNFLRDFSKAKKVARKDRLPVPGGGAPPAQPVLHPAMANAGVASAG
jgi:replicative DNA helicase